MMALTHSLRIFVSAILLGLPCVGNAEGEELSSEEIVQEMAQIPLEKDLIDDPEKGFISDCPGSCNSFAPSAPYPPAMAPGQPPVIRFPLQPPSSGPMSTPVSPPPQAPHMAQPPIPQSPGPQLSGPPHLFQSQPAPSFSDAGQKLYPKLTCPGGRGNPPDGFTINFDNISIVQLIQFISKISNSNFIYNAADLQGPDGKPLTITIVSEDPASVDDLSAALLQVLKMNNLSVTEQGNNVLIYRNQNMSKVSRVITDSNLEEACGNAVITRVFQLYNVDPTKIAAIVKTLVSPEANVEPSAETRHLIVTDITANVNKIADLLLALDTPQLAIDIFEYQVQFADPICLAGHAREILEPLAVGATFSITPEANAQKIFIVSTPFIIEKARRILASLDMDGISCLIPLPPPITELKNNSFYMYKLKYQNGQDIAFALHEIGINLQSTGVSNIDFVNTIFSVQWLPVNNSIVIAGTDDSIQKVVALIDDLDTLPKQVYLEVLILDTTLSNSLDFGVQWIALGDEQNKLAYGTGLLSNSPSPDLQGSVSPNFGARGVAGNNNPLTGGPPAVPNPGNNVPLPVPANLVGILPSGATSAFGLGIVGNILRHNGRSFLTLGALISALDEEADSTIVLNPKIMVEDTQPANFFVGQNIPYQTTSTVIQQTGSVTQNIQYEDIGIDLQITPTISPDNMVTLLINQTVASINPIGGLPGSSNLTPVTNKILATTRVHVPDGTFLVMSGHISDEVTYIRSGIPCLGTLPLIGPVFSRTIEQRRKRNLIFFIRPQVVTSPEGGVRLSDEEGYQHNWDANPCSIFDCGPIQAPECQIYPILPEMHH